MLRSAALLSALLLQACAARAPTLNGWTSDAAGFDTHSWWTETPEGVVVFDAQFTPAHAEQLLADIRTKTDAPVTTVVVTHPNPDKFLGAAVFQEAGAELVASQATADAMPEVWAYKKAFFVGTGAFTDEMFPALPAVDRTFEGELDLGNGVRLRELSHPGVTTTQTVAIVGDDLVVGDLVAGRAHAWLEGGIVGGAAAPDLAAWESALGELGALGSGEVYPGRGEVLPVETAVSEQIRYLTEMDRVVSAYVGALPDPLAALTGAESATHYAAITAEAEAAFPDNTLSYLVTYGVYGLAMQHAGN